MEEDLVLLRSYLIDEKELLIKLENGEEFKDEDIERFDIQGVLKENMIFYKNELKDSWFAKDYKILVEVYVYDIDYNRANMLLEEFEKEIANAEFNYEGLEGYEGVEEDNNNDEEEF